MKTYISVCTAANFFAEIDCVLFAILRDHFALIEIGQPAETISIACTKRDELKNKRGTRLITCLASANNH